MEKASPAESYTFGDQNTSDITVILNCGDGGLKSLFCHSTVLVKRSEFFAEQLLENHASGNFIGSAARIQVPCHVSQYDHYVKLIKLLYVSGDPVPELWDSVKSALGVLRASVTLRCSSITDSCARYLEAVPWDGKEEEEILKIIPALGDSVARILVRVQPVGQNATKNVLISAIHFATAAERSCPPFIAGELRTSAQEQVEYMLLEDGETPYVTVDEEVRSEARTGLGKLLANFEAELGAVPEASEERVVRCLADLEWMCGILSKMEMMSDFVASWAEISDRVLSVVEDEKYSSGLWEVKAKVIELVGKALDAVGYGSVVLPAPARVRFVTTWLPYLRKMKPRLDSMSEGDESFAHRLDGDLCQNIEGAIVSLILALPGGDQADILGEWLQRTEELKFPDLSEAFEIWCYRTKTAKRRLMLGLNGVGNPTLSL